MQHSAINHEAHSRSVSRLDIKNAIQNYEKHAIDQVFDSQDDKHTVIRQVMHQLDNVIKEVPTNFLNDEQKSHAVSQISLSAKAKAQEVVSSTNELIQTIDKEIHKIAQPIINRQAITNTRAHA